MQLHCPHCNDSVELPKLEDDSEIVCPGCGSSFGIAGEETVTMPSETGQRVAHFELIEKLGTGAFGTVWKARDTKLDRIVAIKLSRRTSSQDIARFFREARSAAQLRHTSIVGVHDVGSDGETTFIVSDYVQGATLSELLSVRSYSDREAAEVCLRIAEGLEHAHDSGIIHRDMKPGNIMMDGQGNPQIVDFGLARREAADVTMTIQGQILGTAYYMSPEQASGESHNADARSDIYSLGVILYQMLTGERPFRGTTQAVIYQVINEPVSPPRKLNHRVSRDLEAVCLKAMEKEPERRYRSAREFADDLQRFLVGEHVRARPSRLAARVWRWCHQADRIRDAGAYLAFVGVLLFTWALVGFANLVLQFAGPVEQPMSAWFGMIAFMSLWVLLFFMGILTLRMNVAGIYGGLAGGSVSAAIAFVLMFDLVPFSMGGVYENVEARLPLFSLMFLLALIMTILYAIAILAYYSNPHVVRWARGKSFDPPSAQAGSHSPGH